MLRAHMAFAGGASHPIAAALPDWVCLSLASVSSCEPVLALHEAPQRDWRLEALSRAFRAHTGQSPRRWRKAEIAAG